jgi:ferredoxin
MPPDKILAELVAEIKQIVRTSPDNEMPGGGRYFDEPLVGVAAGNDPLFLQYKEIIGPFHWLPNEVMSLAGFGTQVTLLSVISWVLPINSAVRMSNRREKLFPSREWALTRNFGEIFNSLLRRHVVDWFTRRGIQAAAPLLVDGWSRANTSLGELSSTWSERHAAYAARLGTFSLNDGFITERGIAHRLGSVVAAIELPASPGQLKGVYDNCLYYNVGRCGVCIPRCPVKALSGKGHDKNLCREHVYITAQQQAGPRYGVNQTGCGLCQTAVPCEALNPCK